MSALFKLSVLYTTTLWLCWWVMKNETRSLIEDKVANKFLAGARVENKRQLTLGESSRASTWRQRTFGGLSYFVCFKAKVGLSWSEDVEIRIPHHTTPVGTSGCKMMAQGQEDDQVGWGGKSVSKVPGVQAWRPEIRSLVLTLKAGVVVCA